MSEEIITGPYDHLKCHFKFKGCTKSPAAYGRRENDNLRGPFFDACENCARIPYPQPKQLQQEETIDDQPELV